MHQREKHGANRRNPGPSVADQKEYLIDLTQYAAFMTNTNMQLNRNNLSAYIPILHQRYNPNT